MLERGVSGHLAFSVVMGQAAVHPVAVHRTHCVFYYCRHRYDQMSTAACEGFAPVIVLLGFISIFASQVILALRVSALWGKDRRIVIALVVLLAFVPAGVLASMGLGWVPAPVPPLLGAGCWISPRASRSLAIIITCWVPACVVDTALFALMLTKTLHGYCTEDVLPGGGVGKASPPRWLCVLLCVFTINVSNFGEQFLGRAVHVLTLHTISINPQSYFITHNIYRLGSNHRGLDHWNLFGSLLSEFLESPSIPSCVSLT